MPEDQPNREFEPSQIKDDSTRVISSLLSHDLRTPINHILGYCELLAEEQEDAQQMDRVAHLREILYLGKLLLRIIVAATTSKDDATTLVARDLAGQVQIPLNQIKNACDWLVQDASGPQNATFLCDLERVQAATVQLQTLASTIADGSNLT